MMQRLGNAQQQSPASVSTQRSDVGGMSTTSVSIRAIRELLSDFEGREDTFWRWRQQLELLMATYNLDENTVRVLISSKLKKRALEWFHSKSEHLMISIADLLRSLATLFDDRPKKLKLRKDFEARIWQKKEPFSEYYHDKLILANRVPIADDEIIDYLIEGIPDERLQDNARMMQFKEKSSLLEAFKKINLDTKKK